MKKREKGVLIDNQRVYYSEYGMGTRRVYLIGPCIVRGMCVRDEDSLGKCIFDAFKQRSMKVKIVCLSPESGTFVRGGGIA